MQKLLTIQWLIEEDVMNDLPEDVAQAICIGVSFSLFLLNTGRTLKGFELYNECLILLNTKAQGAEKLLRRPLGKSFYGPIYIIMAKLYSDISDYTNAKKYGRKLLDLYRECSGTTNIKDRAGEAAGYLILGTVFFSLVEYDKAKEYIEKSLAISIEIGDRQGEGKNYENLGTVFQAIGEFDKAKEYHEKALAIISGTGHREGESAIYGNLGYMFQSLGEYDKAEEYLEKALAIKIEIGDRVGEARDYGNLGAVFHSLGEYDKAKKHLEKSLAITIKIGNRKGEMAAYGNLGVLFYSLGEYAMAEGYLKKALLISQDIGDARQEFICCYNLAGVKLSQKKFHEVSHYLCLSAQKNEDLRGFLRDNDQFKITLLHVYDFPHEILCVFLCSAGNPNNALYVLEFVRARALADLMATQYSVERQISANPQSWIGIEDIMKKNSNRVCLYIYYVDQDVFLWIVKTSGVIHFRKMPANKIISDAGSVGSLEDFLAKSFCNDDEIQVPERSLYLLYKLIIAPVADLLDESEIIIVPDRSFFQVPFAALTDEGGKYLSETFRIRIVPSLTTLKLIQDSPADYHSQTGALIVGDPAVGEVLFKGRGITFPPLPCARKEAKMIGELLGVQPLSGKSATKQAVLQMIHSASLIHFAAHGDAERGEIALSPLCTATAIPQEEDYLLTMSDISQVRLRAKLVVLSCCHSGRGQIRAEGVVGIARAFLGSGARSVLVALWALDDLATEQFMKRFYEHLVRGESASESLHEAMKWMRGNGFAKVSEWAPFMLIGDNVTFDTEKLKKAEELEPEPA
ncbi:tetratricopeptide repeat protein 28-like [Oculina patagonica]